MKILWRLKRELTFRTVHVRHKLEVNTFILKMKEVNIVRTPLGVRATLFTDQVTTFQKRIQKQLENKRFEPVIFWSETLLSNVTFHGAILNVSTRVDCVTAWCKRSLLDEDMIWRQFITVRFAIEKEFYHMDVKNSSSLYSIADLM